MARNSKIKNDGEKQAPSRFSATRGSMNLHMKFLVVSGRDEMKISRSLDGQVQDLSPSGLIFRTSSMRVDDLHLSYDESPILRNKLTMEIDLPGGKKVTAIGEVSWYERSFVAKDQIYHIGVAFREMSPEDRLVLKEYLLAVKRTVRAIDLDV
jgi:hypothetical protein